MSKRSSSIRAVVSGAEALIFLVTIAAFAGYWYGSIQPLILSGERTKAELLSAGSLREVEQAVVRGDREQLEQVLGRMLLLTTSETQKPIISRVELSFRDGTTVTREGAAASRPRSNFLVESAVFSSTNQEFLGVLRVFYDEALYQGAVRKALRVLLLVATLVVLLNGLLQLLLWVLLRPLETLASTLGLTETAESVDLPRLHRYATAEIRRMYDSVQDLFERLGEARQRDRARAEELRQAGAYNRSLIESSLDPLVTIAPDGKITDVNHATEAVTGRSRQELIGADFSDFFTDPEKAQRGYQQVFREGLVQDYELEVRSRDGRTTPVLYNASVYRDEGGAITGVFAAARDITERKRAEEALAQKARELARSNADLEQFAYVASHDLQEPLRTVANFTQLLARRYRGRLDQDADDYIDFAVDGATRMQTLIQDLLSYSRVGTRGKNFEPVDCNELLGRAMANLQETIVENTAFVVHEELPTVLADPSQLVQLFQNLIGNAIKFHGLEPPRVHVSAACEGTNWLFAVRDNGIGIDPQYADRVFVIFQRLHSREEYPGTGIGLALCKKIVERHHGKIWVESELGKGATFFFTLPGN